MNILKRAITFLRAPRYVLVTPRLNKLGLQEWRINSKLRELKAKRGPLPDHARKAICTLEENGICLIHDFLSDSEHQELSKEIELLRKSPSIKRESGKEGGQIEWEHGNFSADLPFAVVNAKFRSNKALQAIVEHYTNRRILFDPEVIYQKLTLPDGVVDKDDVQTVLHADRYYRTIKIFYTVSDHTAENGAFWYSPGSHKMDAERIKFEKDFSYRAALERSGRKGTIDPEMLENGRSVIHPELKNRFPPEQICAKKNTLIIADVSGFHKRGLLSKGCSRETIRIIFHYIHAPLWGQKLLNALRRSPGRYLN
jgi:hypothetical protein